MSEGYEKRDVSVKAIGLGTLATVLLIVVFIVFLRDYFILAVEKTVHAEIINNPNLELIEINNKDEVLLNGYGVLDKDKGIYKIPIEDAMKAVVSEYNSEQ